MSMRVPTSVEVGRMIARVEEERGGERAWKRRRFMLRASVVEAERLENGNWKVYGHGWLRDGVEFTDENFRANFKEEL